VASPAECMVPPRAVVVRGQRAAGPGRLRQHLLA